MESKDLLDLCRQAGFDVKNQLSRLDPEQRVVVEEIVMRSGGGAAAPPPRRGPGVFPRVDSGRVRVLQAGPGTRREPGPVKPAPAPPAPPREVKPVVSEPAKPVPVAPVPAPEPI